MSHDVFISYSTKDKTIADAVCAKLEESKIRSWIAPRDVPAGSNFAESIIDAIDTCKVFVLIWSSNTNKSEHILTELNQAFDQGIPIIPFRIQDVQPNSAMRYYIGRTHWLDALTPPLEKHIATLKDTILVNLGREALPKEPTQIPPFPQVIPEGKERPTTAKKLSKENPPQKKLTTALLSLGGIVLLGLIGLLLFGKFKGILPANLFQSTLQSSQTPDPTLNDLPVADQTIIPTSTTSPTITPLPVPTSTPIPGWVEVIAEPILAFIAEQTPNTVEDGFNQDEGWSFSPAPEAQGCNSPDDAIKEISKGTMKLSIVSCRVANLSRPIRPLTNFVLQMDVNFHDNPIGLEFRFWNRSPLVDGGQVAFYIQSPDGNGGLVVMKNETEIDSIGLDNSMSALDLSKPVTITIINKSPYILIYVDSILLIAYGDQEYYKGPFEMDFTVNSWSVTPTEYLMLELDNVRIWDLDRVNQ